MTVAGKTDRTDRKDDHLSICLNEKIEFYSEDANGFGAYRFEHDALPEIDYAAISLETTLLGKKLSAPLMIGAMTGGTDRAAEINRRLAKAAERCQVGLALGSQRKLFTESHSITTDRTIIDSYAVKNSAPNLPLLLGNLGAVQLNYGVRAKNVRSLIDVTACDAFNFHLNPLQEAIQPEGDRNFADLLPKLRDCIPELGVPVLVKEVGAGISSTTARKLKSLPLSGIETAGAGGTSWAKIEGLRTPDDAGQDLGTLFARWGIPTAESVIACKRELPNLTLIASGGIRNGLEIAKALALGADAAALALPVLKAAEQSIDHAVQAIESLKTQLKTALFVTGMKSIADLKARGPLVLLKTTSRGHA